MPTFDVKTVSATQVWASRDGARKIFEVKLDYKGQPVSGKTYSEVIATPGWSGTVETYEKVDSRGSQTFVKQPPKENSGYSGGRTGGSKPQADPFTMYLSYAKDIAVALIGTKDGFDEARYGELLDAVSTGGHTLYEARESKAQGSGAVSNSQREPLPPEPDSVHDPGEISMDDISKALGDVEVIPEGETPWPNPTS